MEEDYKEELINISKYNRLILISYIVGFILYGIAVGPALFISDIGFFANASPWIFLPVTMLLIGIAGGWFIAGIVGGIWLGIRFIRKQDKNFIILACVLFQITLVVSIMVGFIIAVPLAIKNIISIRKTSNAYRKLQTLTKFAIIFTMCNLKPKRVKMNLNKAKIKNYLIETTALQKDKTLKSQLLHFRNTMIWSWIITLVLLYLLTFNSDYAYIGRKIIFIITITLMFIIPIIILKKLPYRINNWKTKEKLNFRKYNSLAGILAGIMTAIFILLYNHLNLNISEIFLVFVMSSSVIFAMNFICILQYKLYLLNKYCPEVKDMTLNEL